jgi:AcrR family transcriptional regulator
LKAIPAGRRKLPREVREEHQRARVLEAAIEIFAEAGYSATTVDDLVAGAKMGVGSFYAHFSGKEECLLAAHRQVVAEARAVVTSAGEVGSSWEAQVFLGLRALLDWVAKQPKRARVALVEVQTGGDRALAQYHEVLVAVDEFLRRGRQARELPRRLPESLEQTTVSGIAWLLHRRLVIGEAIAAPELFEELGVLILEPYLGAKAATEAVAEGGFVSVS